MSQIVSVEEFAGRILYEHDGTIVWNKPAGLASTGRDLEDADCAQYLAMKHYRRMIWAVHQIDAETSGVLVFVRRKALVAQWKTRLAARTTVKRYLAIVHGRLPMRKHIVREPVGGKEARSDFRELAYCKESGREGASLLEVCIHTGRTHQIRVHLEYMGMQLFGEKRYGGAACDEHFRHALHASAILFKPEAGSEESGVLAAPLPDDMVGLAARLGLELTKA